MQPSEVNLVFSPFWVRFYNLPFWFRSDDNNRMIGASLGDVFEIEKDFLSIEPFRRVWSYVECD